MTSSVENSNGQTILVAIESIQIPQGTLELAVAIAASLKSSVQGLFLEDSDLIQVAELSFTREILLSSGKQRSLESSQVKELINKRADESRETLALLAKQSAVQWSYRVQPARGHRKELIDTLEADFIVLGQSLANLRSRGRWRSEQRKRILFVETGAPKLLHALEVLLLRLADTAVQISFVDYSDDKRALKVTEDWLRHSDYRIDKIKNKTMAELVQVPNVHFDYVIISRGCPSAILRDVLTLAECLVIVAP